MRSSSGPAWCPSSSSAASAERATRAIASGREWALAQRSQKCQSSKRKPLVIDQDRHARPCRASRVDVYP